MKPTVKLIGEDGNIFNILAKCMKALKDVGKKKEADEMIEKAFNSNSYEEALSIVMKYVEIE